MRSFVGTVRFNPFFDIQRSRVGLAHQYRTAKRTFAISEAKDAVFIHLDGATRVNQEISRRDSHLFAGRAFLHNADEITRQLNLAPGTDDVSVAEAAFRLRGDAGLASLLGNFALAHWDKRRQQLTLVRDYGRGDSLFFYRGEGFVAFASHLNDLLAHPSVPKELDEVVLASFLAGDRLQKRRTFFRNVERVPTRSVVTITGSKTQHRIYWSPQFRETQLYARDEDYIERARELLDRAVSRVLKDSPRFAVSASGGLDSSAIVTTLARKGIAPVPCYTRVPGGADESFAPSHEYASERPKTERLAEMHPALQFRYFGPSDLRPFEHSDERYFDGWPTPLFGPCLMRLSEPLYGAIAADGFKVVLVGFAGNLGLTWDGFNLLPELMCHGQIVTLLREAKATASNSGSATWRVLGRELIAPSLPLWMGSAISRLRRNPSYLRNAEMPMNSRIPLRPDIIEQLDLPRVLKKDGVIRPAILRRRTRQDRAERMFGFAYRVHETRSLVESRYGLELRDPLADRDLLEFSLNVPERLYRRNGATRCFARAVLADRVPAEILHETRYGAQATSWFSALSARRAEIAQEVDRMEDSLMASRFFDIPRLKQMIADWPKDAAEAEERKLEYILSLEQAAHAARFMRWANRSNA